jgi:16S rRNA (uracil1498-N3)-methyltransferase
MQVFYSTNISGDIANFDKDESGHVIRVLRMRSGDSLTFTDGLGNMYEGVITGDDPKMMQVKISSFTQNYGQRPYRLHMAVSPLKNHDRFEWFIEKAVEMGIDEITPVICSRTEKTGIKKDRLQKLILSAMKQSVKARLPILNETVSFSDFISGNHPGEKIIAHCIPEIRRVALTEKIEPGKDIVILIGPEGDFTSNEVRMAEQAGFTSVHIGTSRLRTETAGISACCSVYLVNI